MRKLITTCLIFLFWLLLSGHTEPLLIILGLLSTLLTLYLSDRMDVIDHESYPVNLGGRILRFYLFLGKEIIISNINVIKRIINPASISPQVVSIPAAKKTNLGKVIYANSITLTPGTVTLSLIGDELKVHALDQQSVDSLRTGEMATVIPENTGDQS